MIGLDYPLRACITCSLSCTIPWMCVGVGVVYFRNAIGMLDVIALHMLSLCM